MQVYKSPSHYHLRIVCGICGICVFVFLWFLYYLRVVFAYLYYLRICIICVLVLFLYLQYLCIFIICVFVLIVYLYYLFICITCGMDCQFNDLLEQDHPSNKIHIIDGTNARFSYVIVIPSKLISIAITFICGLSLIKLTFENQLRLTVPVSSQTPDLHVNVQI